MVFERQEECYMMLIFKCLNYIFKDFTFFFQKTLFLNKII